MTFYEAALRVLEREGKPLHVNAIIEIALKDNLLSHVGKSPEDVMQSRLLTMARRRTERKVVATAPLTYGLVEWGIAEDPAALAAVSDGPNADEKPLRPRERHPVASPDKVRVAGRSERLRKVQRREEEGEDRKRRRKYPPLSEVAFEVLSHVGGSMPAVDLAAAARDRDLVSEDLGAEALLHALREDNRRRTEAGRRPAFIISASGDISVARGAALAEPPMELEHALGVAPAEGKPERGPGATRIMAQAADHRRQILRLVRRRLGDLDAAGFERAGLALLDQQGFRDVKVARRGKEGPLVIARRKDGLADLRWAVQIFKGGSEVRRQDVADLRKDCTQFGAQIGLVLSPAEVARDARQETQSAGSFPVLLWCADAVAEKFMEARLGACCHSVEVFDLEEDFFRRCRDRGRDEERSRRSREDRPQPVAPLQQEAAPPPPPPAEVERTPDASAPAVQQTDFETAAAEQKEADERRRIEERLRSEAHERIEAAELQARLKGAPAG